MSDADLPPTSTTLAWACLLDIGAIFIGFVLFALLRSCL